MRAFSDELQKIAGVMKYLADRAPGAAASAKKAIGNAASTVGKGLLLGGLATAAGGALALMPDEDTKQASDFARHFGKFRSGRRPLRVSTMLAKGIRKGRPIGELGRS